MKTFDQLHQETTAAQFGFLTTELATGNTFLEVAATTSDAETRARNIQNAKLACTTAKRLSANVDMTSAQEVEFQESLKSLELRLRQMEQTA